jgi:hypothetical protein
MPVAALSGFNANFMRYHLWRDACKQHQMTLNKQLPGRWQGTNS